MKMKKIYRIYRIYKIHIKYKLKTKITHMINWLKKIKEYHNKCKIREQIYNRWSNP
jgi:hypothetical protein